MSLLAPVTTSAPPPREDDHTLLHRYATDKDNSALATLVHRHAALVHSAAARRLGDRHLAQDVTQAVFIILSRKSASIPPTQPLSAWLLTTTRYAAANALKLQSRRRRHEEAAAMSRSQSSPGTCSPDPSAAILWQDLAGHLDDAVLRLPSLDRKAILLRYFEDRPLRDIAHALHCSEGAVKQRLSRALEKLRARLNKLTNGTLAALPLEKFATLLTSHAVTPAPLGLAAAATTTALSTTLATTSSTLLTPHIAKGAMKMMAWTKLKLVAAVVACATLAGTGGVVTLNHALAQAETPTQTSPPAASTPKPRPAARKSNNKQKADNYLGILVPDDAPPVVVKTLPEAGATDVDPATTELKVTFSKDMTDGSWSWAQISDSSFPEVTTKPHYESDHRTCVLPVKLQPNHTYILQLNYPPFDNFTDANGRKAVRYLYVFRTKD